MALTREEMKARALARIDAHRALVLDLVERIYREPEVGFHEHQTAAAVRATFEQLGVPYQHGIARTGVKGELRGRAGAGPAVAVMGELDALIVPDHVDAHPVRRTAHACGHNAQIGSMVGAVIGLQADGVLDALSGRVVAAAVPAEECIDVRGRLELKARGELEFLVGKAEWLRLGAFDDVDMAMVVHTASNETAGARFGLPATSNGALIKMAQFLGRASHAGSGAFLGVNALSAATLALAAIDAQRATFRDEDTVRVHPIITSGGDVVSVVPADVRLEIGVRANTVAALEDANRKVDRALRAGALAVGARVRVTTIPAYMPLAQDDNLTVLFAENVEALVGPDQFSYWQQHSGSTDAGNLSLVMPVLHPLAAGAVGNGHSAEYRVVDVDNAVLNASKVMAMTVIDLLADDAAEARQVLADFKPPMSRAEYHALMQRLGREQEYDER